VHDALVTRLMLRRKITDEAMGMLVRRFPAVASLEMTGNGWGVLTDAGLRAVSSLRSLTFLNLSWCREVSDEGMRAVSSLPALTSLSLSWCYVTDAGLRAVSNLPALTFLELRGCPRVTAAGVQALRSSTAPGLHIIR
jgi:hypothetical protein